jgi:hypothetical protein
VPAVPTIKGDACRCADGYYNASRGHISCNDVGLSAKLAPDDRPFVLGLALSEDKQPICAACPPGDCVSCDGGIVRVKAGWAVSGSKSRSHLPIDAIAGVRAVRQAFTSFAVHFD